MLLCCDSATEQHHRALRHCTVCRRRCSGLGVVVAERVGLWPCPSLVRPTSSTSPSLRALSTPSLPRCLWTWSLWTQSLGLVSHESELRDPRRTAPTRRMLCRQLQKINRSSGHPWKYAFVMSPDLTVRRSHETHERIMFNPSMS